MESLTTDAYAAEQIALEAPGVIRCACGHGLDVAVYRTARRPNKDVPDEHITYFPAPRHLAIQCNTCRRWFIFAPSSAIKIMKAKRGIS